MHLPFSLNQPLYLVISLIGIYVIIQAVRSAAKADASRAWSGAQGRIIESRLEKRESTDYDDGSTDLTYQAVVRYTYTVMGQEYTGDRVAFGVRSSNRNAASQVVDRYPLDKQVMVYYNPQKPQDAVLEQVTKSSWVQSLIGALLIIVGVYLALK